MQFPYQNADIMLYFIGTGFESEFLRKAEMQTSRLTAVIILIMAAIYIICRLIGSGKRLTSRAYNRSKDRRHCFGTDGIRG